MPSVVLVTPDEINLLFSPRSESQFRNVYRCGQTRFGIPLWHAKIRTSRTLKQLPHSRSTNRRHAAACVIRWYKEWFGGDWQVELRGNKSHPVRARAWRVDHSKRHRGYLLSVWVNGNPEVCCEVRDGTPTDEPLVFASRKAAKAFRFKYLDYRYGAARWERRLVLRRAGQVPPPEAILSV